MSDEDGGRSRITEDGGRMADGDREIKGLRGVIRDREVGFRRAEQI